MFRLNVMPSTYMHFCKTRHSQKEKTISKAVCGDGIRTLFIRLRTLFDEITSLAEFIANK